MVKYEVEIMSLSSPHSKHESLPALIRIIYLYIYFLTSPLNTSPLSIPPLFIRPSLPFPSSSPPEPVPSILLVQTSSSCYRQSVSNTTSSSSDSDSDSRHTQAEQQQGDGDGGDSPMRPRCRPPFVPLRYGIVTYRSVRYGVKD
jgi:hypothetical protein